MRKITFLLAALATGAYSMLGAVAVVRADTHVDDGTIAQDTSWDKAGSPYILETPVTVYPDASLTIGPGVQVRGDPSLEDGPPGISVNQGSLLIQGKGDSRVSFQGLANIYVFKGSLDMADADVVGSGITLEDSRVSIATSTISQGTEALHIHDSSVSVSGSRIYSDAMGITVAASGNPVLIERMQDMFGTGGIGNALDDIPAAASSSVIISGSSIYDNSQYGLRNLSSKLTVQAGDNWWGSAAGPAASGPDSVSGLVDYAPWLTAEPPLDAGTVAPSCCSSILFIPGMEASRLYDAGSGSFGLGSSTAKLWEPQNNAGASKLYLNANGSSTDKSVYSGGPIDSVLGLVDIYGKFMDYLDGLSQNGTINAWKAFGYDWREPIAEVVAGAQKKATTTESLVDTVSALAAGSKTGKVTIIAHSNGGLVAKYLVKTLSDTGKSNLIDSVISVAVPYLGTPEAILALLHGYDQSLGYGLLLSKTVARGLAQNMPSAYSLLPSRQYFSHIAGPTIAFASSTVVGVNDGSYPKAVSTFDQQSAFIDDTANVRSAPSSADTSLPIKGNRTLMASADALHAALDAFVWPSSIARWAIIGWDVATSKAIAYYTNTKCLKSLIGMKCAPAPAFQASTTAMGDGTVVAPSAAYNAGTAVSLDLKAISHEEGKDISHANILEASSTKAAIDGIITGNTGNPADGDDTVVQDLSRIPGVAMGEPDYSKEATYLVLSTHSPVELHVYDKDGNHTGILPLPADLNVQDGLYTRFETNIPGSTFDLYGDDDDPQTYIYLPDDSGQTYSVVMNGTGVGEFTYDVERVQGDQTLESVEYSALPVTPLMVATTTVTARASETVPMPPLASSTPPVAVDIDGDGIPDIQARPGAQPDPIAFLESFRKTVVSLMGASPRAVNICDRIARLEDLFRKGKLGKANAAIANLDIRIQHKKFKKLSDADRQQIVDMIDQFVEQFE